MNNDPRLKVVKDLIESGSIRTFADIFLYIHKTPISLKLGIKYARFLKLAKDPKRFRYEETASIAAIFQVSQRLISELVHNQMEIRKAGKKNPSV